MNTNEIQVGDTIKVTRIGRKVGRTHQIIATKTSGLNRNDILFVLVPDSRNQNESLKWINLMDGLDTIELIAREEQVA
jgi:hypothetical protein